MFDVDRIRPIASDDEVGALRITIPAPKNWGFTAFLALWMCGWAMGEVAVSTRLIQNALVGGGLGTNEFAILLVWLPVWTVAGLWTILNILWNMIGREVITFGKERVELRVEVGLVRRARWLDLHEFSNLRYAPSGDRSARWTGLHPFYFFSPGGTGSVALDGADMTYHFGYRLAEYEALRVIGTIERRFKLPRPLRGRAPAISVLIHPGGAVEA